MIREKYNGESNQTVKHKFRRTGPLDAYIYKTGGDNQDVEQSQDNMMVHPIQPIIPQQDTLIPTTHIFTDGACTNNGRKNANAAWGAIIVADKDYKVLNRLSAAIPKSEPQTNQRAELQALLKGLQAAEQIDGFIKLWSDSQYAINCASVWGPSWKRKGWVKQGGVIQHLDIIKPLVNLTESIRSRIEFKWLKGHKGGDAQHQFPWMFNHQVDALATGALA